MNSSTQSVCYRGQGFDVRRKTLLLQRVGDAPDAPRALTSFRGILVAAGLSLVFWTGVLNAIL